MINVEFLADGIKQVNQAYIERPDFNQDDYRGMVVQYIISALLIALGETANDFGFYDKGEYTGWLGIGNEIILFAPTRVTIIKKTLDFDLWPVRQD